MKRDQAAVVRYTYGAQHDVIALTEGVHVKSLAYPDFRLRPHAFSRPSPGVAG